MSYDEKRMDRMNRLNPPEYPPGQDPNSSNMASGNTMDAIFNTSTQPVNTQSLGDVFNTGAGNTFNTGNNMVGASQNGQLNMGLPPQQGNYGFGISIEDAKKAMNSVIGGSKDIFSAFKYCNSAFYYKVFHKMLFISFIWLVIWLILLLTKHPDTVDVFKGSMLSFMISVPTYTLLGDKAKRLSSIYNDELGNNTVSPIQQPGTNTSSVQQESDWGSSWGEFSDSSSSEDADDWGFEDDIEDDGDLISDEDEDDWDFSNDITSGGEAGMSTEDALNSLSSVPHGMYTRQYLFEAFTKVLSTMIPNFNRFSTIDDSMDEFLDWEDRVREAAEATGCKPDNLPEIESIEENLFMVVIRCTRPSGFKADLVADEVARLYAYRGGSFDSKVFAKADTLGKSCILSVFTGKTGMVSLKDMMLVEKDFLLNSSNVIPIVVGMNERGDVIRHDFKLLESIIITGMPRKGKSWFTLSVLTQMCAFCSPKELHLYIGDPKDGISDYNNFVLPHVKRFESEDSKVLNMLRELVKVEAPRRTKIIGDASNVNIWDFKKRYPDVNLPIIYVVIDEIITFASRMDKETNQEFRALLRELISRLPALGIRAIIIPHVLNNDIIEKKTSDMVPCKISVMGDAEHIEKATGSKPKDFPFKLANKGDMAVKMTDISANTMFVHAPAISATNEENTELFDYMRRMWSILEPDEVRGSMAQKGEDLHTHKELLNKVQDASMDLGLFSNISDADNSYNSASEDFLRNIF